MTTKTDNYRELTNSPHSWHSDNDRTEDCEICKRNDAIAALIKERDTVAKWRDIFDKQASGLFMECWEQKTNNRILARENERLRDMLEAADEHFTEHIRQCVNGGPSSCFACDQSSRWQNTYRAVLANAPTPNDKGKWNMEISQEDLRRLISGAYKAGVIGVVGLMRYSQYDYNRIGQDFAREQVARWIAEGGK